VSALPVAGLMSTEPIESVCRELEELHRVTRYLGCELAYPFGNLSFLALPVIPERASPIRSVRRQRPAVCPSVRMMIAITDRGGLCAASAKPGTRKTAVLGSRVERSRLRYAAGGRTGQQGRRKRLRRSRPSPVAGVDVWPDESGQFLIRGVKREELERLVGRDAWEF
jgi:hypothetical protein